MELPKEKLKTRAWIKADSSGLTITINEILPSDNPIVTWSPEDDDDNCYCYCNIERSGNVVVINRAFAEERYPMSTFIDDSKEPVCETNIKSVKKLKDIEIRIPFKENGNELPKGKIWRFNLFIGTRLSWSSAFCTFDHYFGVPERFGKIKFC